MDLSLGAAAKMAGMNKTTLSRHIKAGRLSARRADDGSYAIDASELARAYGLRLPETGSQLSQCIAARPLSDPPATPAALGDTLMAELRAQLAQAHDTVADLRARLDASEARLDRVLLSLPAPGVTPPPTPHRPSFLARLLGRS